MKLLACNRRSFLRQSMLARLAPLLLPAGSIASVPQKRDSAEVYRRLGVRTYINARGTQTFLGGSIMTAEVMEAMDDASRHYVDIHELLEKSGQRIAELTGAESALVTAGASAAMTMGTAACITGTDPEKVRRMPDTSEMKNEVILQRSHDKQKTAGGTRGYLRAILVAGARLVKVENREELEAAINERTAMMHFASYCEPHSAIPRKEWAEIGKKHGIPTFLDAAADVPPRSRFQDFVNLGFDLITFSGGKGIRGPQCAGLLLGRKDLIEAAAMNMSPNVFAMGRGYKVGKEEIIGMVAALERFFEVDEEAQMRQWHARIDEIQEYLQDLKGLEFEKYIPEERNLYSSLRISWDAGTVAATGAEVAEKLREGEPAVWVGNGAAGRRQNLKINSFTLQPGEAATVARRVREVLAGLIQQG